ncbi:MAG: hypothetical protein WBD31_29595 [Rubripirellula sp.]
MFASIRFASDLSPWLVCTSALVAAALVAWLYLRETRNIEGPLSFVLPALRSAAVAMVILILAGPVWHRRVTVGTLGRVVFAIDVSESMSVSDSDPASAQPNRLKRAMRMLTGEPGSDGWLASLKTTHDVDVVAFSSGEPVAVWSSNDDEAGTGDEDSFTSLAVEPDGIRTDLASAVSTLGRQRSAIATGTPDDTAERTQTALVVISDGRDNVGKSAIDVAGPMKTTGATVHTIGMGSETEPTEVAIV